MAGIIDMTEAAEWGGFEVEGQLLDKAIQLSMH